MTTQFLLCFRDCAKHLYTFSYSILLSWSYFRPHFINKELEGQKNQPDKSQPMPELESNPSLVSFQRIKTIIFYQAKWKLSEIDEGENNVLF